jgi:hypothetical protein
VRCKHLCTGLAVLQVPKGVASVGVVPEGSSHCRRMGNNAKQTNKRRMWVKSARSVDGGGGQQLSQLLHAMVVCLARAHHTLTVGGVGHTVTTLLLQTLLRYWYRMAGTY